MPVEMASAILEIAKHRYTLKQGIYVISGSNARQGETEFILYIENESIDEKHAVIICEAGGLVIFDLGTRVGTFVDEKKLPALSKCNISKDMSIRFGTVEGKLLCSTLEPQDSSGFHDDSMHLALDQSSEVNLTIPETQCFNPDQCAIADAAKNNISHDTSIPETQVICEPSPKMVTARTRIPEEDIEPNEFCISSQELNECFNASVDSNSKDVLENINWLIDDEQPTAIKQTVNASKQAESIDAINDEELLALETASFPVVANHPQQEDELHSRTHTPDLFDVDLLEEFDKREMRMNNARANRLHNDDEKAEDNKSEANLPTRDEPSSLAKHDVIQAKSPPGADTIAESTIENLPTECKDKPAELDLFEGEQLGDEQQENAVCIGSPLQHSNKENMHMGVAVAGDLEPTQVFISKKGNKAPTTAASSSTSSHGSLVRSDLEPTQVFVPKKQKLGSQLDSFKMPIPTAMTLSTDENDLVPTQLFVPKQSSSSTSNTTNLNSTMVQCDKNENTNKKVKRFFEEKEAELEDDQESSDSIAVTPVKESRHTPNNDANIMMTPEFVSNAFSDLKVPDTAARREFLTRPEHNLEEEDSLTRLLTGSRYRTDFDNLIKSIKNVEESPSKKYNMETDKLLERYIETNPLESPKKKSVNTTASPKKELKFESISAKSEKPEKKSRSSIEMKVKVESKPQKIEKTDDWTATKKSEVSKTNPRKESKQEVTSSSEVSKTKLKVESKPGKTEKTDDTKASSSTKKSELSKEKSKMEIKPDESGKSSKSTANSSSRSLRNKRNASNEPSIDIKRLKKGRSLESKSTCSSVKPTDGNSLQNDDSKNRRERLKRGAAVDEETLPNPKTLKLSKDVREMNDSSNASSTAVERPKGQTKKVSGSLKESGESIHTESRSRKVSKCNSISSAPSTTKSSSKTIGSETSKKESKTVPDISKRTSKRLISQSSSTLNDKNVDKQKELPTRVTRSRNPSIDTNATVPHNASKNTKADSIQKQVVLSQSKDLEHNSSIIPVQDQRRRRISSAHSQEAQVKNNKKDERPTTSRAAARSVSISEPKSSSKPALKIAFTMVDPQKQDELLKHANKKWEITSELKDCEVLVMDAGNRTLKFLIAVAKGIPIVTTKWLEAIQETGTISVRSKYFFKDTVFERSFKFSLLHTLNEAKRAKLFTNFQFLLTTNIIPTPSDMQAVITCAGGTILDKDHMPEESENQELYLISSKKDRQHWHSYRRKNSNLCITSTEAVMLAVMRYDAKILRKQSF